jgi:hypothetical protein
MDIFQDEIERLAIERIQKFSNIADKLGFEVCFTEWYGYAINYPEDREIEERNFECYKSIFEID